MKINHVTSCPLYGGDCILSVSITYTKEEMKKLKLNFRNQDEPIWAEKEKDKSAIEQYFYSKLILKNKKK